jgi:hypothetical protein
MPNVTETALVGVAEAAEILGVSRALVGRWHRTGTVALADGRRVLFPKPVAQLRATPVWRQADIERLRDARNAPADIRPV